MTDTTPDVREALRLAKRELDNCMHNARKGHVCFDGDDFHEALAAVNNALAAASSAAPVAWIDPEHVNDKYSPVTRNRTVYAWLYEVPGKMPLYAHPQPAAHSEAPNSYAAYWVSIRAKVIEALAAEGLEIWSDKDHVWLHRAKTQRSGEALRSDEPIQLEHDCDEAGTLRIKQNAAAQGKAGIVEASHAPVPVAAAPALQEREDEALPLDLDHEPADLDEAKEMLRRARASLKGKA